MKLRAAIRHFVWRWIDIARSHDWELLAVFVAAVGIVRGIVDLLPPQYVPSGTLTMRAPYEQHADHALLALTFLLTGALVLAGIYQARYERVRAGLFLGAAVWGYHGYLSIWLGVLVAATYQTAFSIACGLMFVRAGIEHPRKGGP